MRRRPLGPGFVPPAEHSTHPWCHGKVRYPEFAVAARAAQRVSRAKDDPAEAYACKHCRGFHVGGPVERDIASRQNLRRLRAIPIEDD